MSLPFPFAFDPFACPQGSTSIPRINVEGERPLSLFQWNQGELPILEVLAHVRPAPATYSFIFSNLDVVQYLVKFTDDYIYLPLSSLSLTSWRALAAERQSVIPLLATRRRHYADLWHEQAQQEELGRFLDAWDVDRYGAGGHDSD